MDLVHPEIDRYLERLARADDPISDEMERLAAERRFPIVGPQVGRLLATLTLAAGATRVLELGSGFGYSAWWFARAVGAGGRVVLSESSQKNADLAESFLRRAGVLDRCEIRVGDALISAAHDGATYDVVFNDIDKHDYPRAIPLAHRRLRDGGLFITDNVLWKGRVLDGRTDDAATRGVLEFTRSLYGSPAWSVSILPLRDGIAVATKVG